MGKATTPRTIILKHSMADGNDCRLEWRADFARMQIQLYASIISPALLLDFLAKLPHLDERFQQTGIKGPMDIASRFRVYLHVTHCEGGVWYSLRVYKLHALDSKFDRPEIELAALPANEAPS